MNKFYKIETFSGFNTKQYPNANDAVSASPSGWFRVVEFEDEKPVRIVAYKERNGVKYDSVPYKKLESTSNKQLAKSLVETTAKELNIMAKEVKDLSVNGWEHIASPDDGKYNRSSQTAQLGVWDKKIGGRLYSIVFDFYGRSVDKAFNAVMVLNAQGTDVTVGFQESSPHFYGGIEGVTKLMSMTDEEVMKNKYHKHWGIG